MEETTKTPDRLTLIGLDNYKRPRQAYADKIAALDDGAFVQEASSAIYMSAFAANNRRSDYHWHADACYDEAVRRGNPDLYSRAWERASGNDEP